MFFFEYCIMVWTENARDAILDDVAFDARHQRKWPGSHFIEKLTELQPEEDTIFGGHPTIEAIMNALAEILLLLNSKSDPRRKHSRFLYRSATQTARISFGLGKVPLYSPDVLFYRSLSLRESYELRRIHQPLQCCRV